MNFDIGAFYEPLLSDLNFNLYRTCLSGDFTRSPTCCCARLAKYSSERNMFRISALKLNYSTHLMPNSLHVLRVFFKIIRDVISILSNFYIQLTTAARTQSRVRKIQKVVFTGGCIKIKFVLFV
jgi:hypothetical protein